MSVAVTAYNYFTACETMIGSPAPLMPSPASFRGFQSKLSLVHVHKDHLGRGVVML